MSTQKHRPRVVDRLIKLRERVANGAGELSREVRRGAASGGTVPAVAQPYTDKVRRHAYKVVDRDVDELRAAGWSEDEIFELTVAIAMDAGVSRLEHAWRVLEGTRQ